MRKIILSVIFLLILSACAFADAMVYRGTVNIGSVRSIDSDAGLSVSAEDVGAVLGFTSSRIGDELILTKGNIQIRVVMNSVAAWRGFNIVPLYSAPFEQDGKLWLDAQSTAALFQASVGRDRLKFVKSSGSGNTTAAIAGNASRSEREFGKFDDEPLPQIASLPDVPETQPAVQLPQVKTQPVVQPSQVKTQPVVRPAKEEAAKEEAIPVMASSSSVSRNSGSKSQPRYETFKPNDKKTERGDNYSGTIQGIR